MSSKSKIVFTLFVLLFQAGCSGFRLAEMPRPQVRTDQNSEGLPEVKKNMVAKVHLFSGQVCQGEVFRVSAEELTLIRPSNYGREEVQIQAEEIQKIEIQSASKSGEIFTSTVGVIGLSLSAIFLLFLFGGNVGGTG